MFKSALQGSAVVCLTAAAFGSRMAAADPVDFARDVAPIFESHCIRCHNAGKASGEISLTTADSLNDLGYVDPKDPDASYLLEVVSAAPGHSPAMPKEGTALDEQEIATLRQWIAAGAEWPANAVLRERAKADRDWWSLRPLANVEPPTVADAPAAWRENPIDRFVFAALAAQKLAPNPPADRRTLIRRLTYDLTGLPATPEEIDSFVRDDSPDAYAKLVERLLASPAYGEHWGRHWLDVVRFGESNGFERNVLIDSLWPFRDYVIRSLNADKPFDRLIHEHLAGDVVGRGDPDVEIGTAFLVCGPYDNVGNQDPVQAATIRANTLDEIVRATSEAFLGLTVGCARCHDHKFDPILQRDYYSLSAAFAGVTHGERVMVSAADRQAHDAKVQPLEAEIARLKTERDALLNEVAERAEKQASQWERAWTRPEVDRFGTEETFPAVDARFVRLEVENREDDPALIAGYSIDEFEVWTDEPTPRNVASVHHGATAEGASRETQDGLDPYGVRHAIDGRLETRWFSAGPRLTIKLARNESVARIVFSSDRVQAAERKGSKAKFVGDFRVATSRDGEHWTEVASSKDRQPPTAAHRRARLIELAITDAERDRRGQLARELTDAEKQLAAVRPLRSWWAGVFAEAKGPFRVFLGGDPQRPGDEVACGNLSPLAGLQSDYKLPATASESERRLALGKWLTAPDQSLTPRVLVNRVWHYHFGTGLVDTPSDFGYMGTKPSHPELLDWLARRLIADGWRLKPLHRLMVTSQAYRQSSAWRREAAQADATDRLLWRFPPRRLAAEEIRDTMLHVSGTLDRRMGGPGFRLYRYLQDNVATYVPLDEQGPETYRRAIYHQNARAARVDVLADFDCPDPAFAEPRRAATITPLQALTMMNHRLTLELSARLAERVESEFGAGSISGQVQRVFELCFGREPRPDEMQRATQLAERHGLPALCRAMFNASEFIYVN